MDLKEQVLRVLNETVRPYVQSHGGDVTLVELTDDGVAVVSLTGACAGCPSADLDTKAMIEEVLTRMVPDIQGVELDRNTSPEMLDFIGKMLRHEIELD